jgi:hypothetical protein
MDNASNLKSMLSGHAWLTPAVEALEDAHRHWHDAADSYHDPAEFRRKVDALIQATRNVTFRLQAAKADGPESFAWYDGDDENSWRTFMINDPYMRWLHDARTEVTKRKGLSRTSYALVSVIEGYFKPPTVLMKLPAEAPTEAVFRKAVTRIPKEYREHQAIEILRRWEPDELPGVELLTAVRHCLRILEGLLLHAAEISSGGTPDKPEQFLMNVHIPQCMLVTPDILPLTFEADTGDETALNVRRESVSDDDIEAAGKRHHGGKRPDIANPETIQGFARLIHEGSRAAFKKDGAVLPFAFLRSEDGNWTQYGTLTDSKRGKYLIWRDLGQRTLTLDYDAVVHTGESWRAPLPAEGVTP